MKEREHSFYDALAAYNYGKIGHMIYCSDGCHDQCYRPDPEPQNFNQCWGTGACGDNIIFWSQSRH